MKKYARISRFAHFKRFRDRLINQPNDRPNDGHESARTSEFQLRGILLRYQVLWEISDKSRESFQNCVEKKVLPTFLPRDTSALTASYLHIFLSSLHPKQYLVNTYIPTESVVPNYIPSERETLFFQFVKNLTCSSMRRNIFKQYHSFDL